MKQITQNVWLRIISRQVQTSSSLDVGVPALLSALAVAISVASFSASAPSGLSPMSSGLRRKKISAGSTTKTRVTSPKIDQVSRQPTQANSEAVTTGIQTLENPCPKLAMAMARPRFFTNQRDTVTLTTI